MERYLTKLSKYPTHKSRKRNKPVFPIRESRFYFKDNKRCRISSIGNVKYKTDLNVPIGIDKKFINPRISYVLGKYYLSFGTECENQTPELNDFTVGIDLGIKDLAVISYDGKSKVYPNINKTERVLALERRLKHEQRLVNRKYTANRVGRKVTKTRNAEKQEYIIKKIYNDISNIHNNYIHQITNEIINLRPKRVVMEDLKVKQLVKNRYLSKYISKQCFYKFIEYMKYKCEINGIEFVQADKYYPSSKTCSKCGNVKKILSIKERTYICDYCGHIIDRDLNAAINLENYI